MVIPTKDRPKFLDRALRSVLAQEGPFDLEAIVVNDGGSMPLDLPPSPSADRHVVLLSREVSEGVAAARNLGIRSSRGEWVAFLDDDDFWAPNKIAQQLEALAASGSSWSAVHAVHVDESTTPTVVSECPTDPSALTLGLCTHNLVPGGGSGVMAARRIVVDLGGFDEALSMVADWDMWHRLAHASPVAVVPEILVAYTHHRTSMTALFDDHLAEMERYMRSISAYCPSPPGAARHRYLSWVAVGVQKHHRAQGAAMEARLALRERSMSGLVHALRVLLVSPDLSLRALFGGASAPLRPIVVPWLEPFGTTL